MTEPSFVLGRRFSFIQAGVLTYVLVSLVALLASGFLDVLIDLPSLTILIALCVADSVVTYKGIQKRGSVFLASELNVLWRWLVPKLGLQKAAPLVTVLSTMIIALTGAMLVQVLWWIPVFYGGVIAFAVVANIVAWELWLP